MLLLMWLVCIIVINALAVNVSGKPDPCSPSNRAVDLDSCLSALYDIANDPSHFWFGNSYLTNCPPPLQDNINCSTLFENMPFTLVQFLFDDETSDLSTIDRFLVINYTSTPGLYEACDHNYTEPDKVEFSIDPTVYTTYRNWEVRNHPDVHWEADAAERFTLIIVDPEFAQLKGLYVNIGGNNLADSQVLKFYTSPTFFRRENNIFVFLLYKQMANIGLQNTALLDQPLFNVTNFVEVHQLEGPVAVSWVGTDYDPYGVSLAYKSGAGVNCASLVSNALANHPVRPFLPRDVELKVYLRVGFTNDEFTYSCGMRNVTRAAANFFLDPIGDPVINTADLRTQSEAEFFIRMNKVFPDNAVDFSGKLYTLIIVNPDEEKAGSNWLPYLVGLHVNIEGEGFETSGTIVMPYIYPVPSGVNPGPGKVYFLLYEQANVVTLSDTSGYTHPSACDIPGRCFFDITSFVSHNNLELVGATWLTWTRDEFNKCQM